MPGARCTRSLVCSVLVEHTSVVTTGHRNTRHSRTQWFNGLFRALPGDRAFLSPSSAEMVLSKPGRADLTSTNLTPASRRQDHTILPSALASFVSALLIAHRPMRARPAITSRAQRCRVHRIPPRVRDDRDTPLQWDGTARDIDLIWVRRERKFFWKWDWTAGIRLSLEQSFPRSFRGIAKR